MIGIDRRWVSPPRRSRLFNSAGSWRHNKVTTTLTVYAHLINTDDHTGNMAALGALLPRRRRRTAATSFNCMGSERCCFCVRAVLVSCFHNLRIPRRIFMKDTALDIPRLSLDWTMLTCHSTG
jgi:hypothetical protein